MSARVAFIDDYEISRLVFQTLLSHIPGVEVVMVCSSGEELLKKLPDIPLDVIVVDAVMPDMDGAETIRQARALCPGLHCISISAHDQDEMMLKMVDAGAMAYLSKEANQAELEKAIHAVLRGETCYPDRLQQLLNARSS